MNQSNQTIFFVVCALLGLMVTAVVAGQWRARTSQVDAEAMNRAFQESNSKATDQEKEATKTQAKTPDSKQKGKGKKMETATFGAGCFWCVEAVFQQLEGVEKVKPGYMGGQVDNPTYKQVCTGNTGHAEVIQIEFDPTVISFEELLQVFWTTHDPTTLNRQGADVGSQYRSAVFFHNDAQRDKAKFYKEKLNSEKAFDNPIVTEVSKASKFYLAEDYHQNYYNNNPNNGYCQAVIPPKLAKLKKVFGSKLKKKKTEPAKPAKDN